MITIYGLHAGVFAYNKENWFLRGGRIKEKMLTCMACSKQIDDASEDNSRGTSSSAKESVKSLTSQSNSNRPAYQDMQADQL
ncbi:hypothetical protein QJS10_CPB11g00055 [Acorus calamus]|uniref:Uncharacterized protein n=1 Tax=Acorus calamus TaxID=4465 RepID=A0AAV9DTF3_ACOCL|nr:hypothetical protein QJS10_CPB11g00055 [Acorus calamus]